MDIAGALTGILITSPIMLVAAVAVKLTSKGPVLFKQERMGYMGKKFTFLKFRSMREDVDHSIHEDYMTDFISGRLDSKSGNEVPLFKMADDPRITAVGRFLRKTSIDEFPQFFNVLKGDMSLVGPRPPIPYEVNKYKLWHQKRVIEVKPGITGLWQVGGRSSTTFEDMVRLDLQYVNNWSLKMDINIILKTIKAIISMKGAY
jgi:lipopolysaccharide/colanic/teichoic acid biosynthesis glycosyltransferase